MDIQEYLKGLKKTSKADDIPGTVESYSDIPCAVCGKKLKIMKPCCSMKRKAAVCICGYKVYME
jgi:hypothetical protein